MELATPRDGCEAGVGRRSETSRPVTSGGRRNSQGNQTHWREETGRQNGMAAGWSRWVSHTDARRMNSSEHEPNLRMMGGPSRRDPGSSRPAEAGCGPPVGSRRGERRSRARTDGRAAGGERAEGLPDAPAGGRRRQRGGSVARSNAPTGGMPCCADGGPNRGKCGGEVAHCKRRCASTTTRIPDEPLLVAEEPKR